MDTLEHCAYVPQKAAIKEKATEYIHALICLLYRLCKPRSADCQRH